MNLQKWTPRDKNIAGQEVAGKLCKQPLMLMAAQRSTFNAKVASRGFSFFLTYYFLFFSTNTLDASHFLCVIGRGGSWLSSDYLHANLLRHRLTLCAHS